MISKRPSAVYPSKNSDGKAGILPKIGHINPEKIRATKTGCVHLDGKRPNDLEARCRSRFGSGDSLDQSESFQTKYPSKRSFLIG